MTAHRAITLAQPLPCQLPALQAVHGPKEAGRRLRTALHWALAAHDDWRAACMGRHFDLVLPSFGSPRLEENLSNGGVALVRIDGNTLRFLLVEPDRKMILDQDLPRALRRD